MKHTAAVQCTARGVRVARSEAIRRQRFIVRLSHEFNARITRICFVSTMLALSAILSATLVGCAPKQDVGPLFASAKASYEQAAAVERHIIDTDADRQRAINAAVFDQLAAAVNASLRTLIVSGWDADSRDFRSERAWRGWFGVSDSTPLDADAVAAERERIARHLEYRLRYTTLNAGAEEEADIAVYELYAVRGGNVDALGKPPSPSSRRALLDAYVRQAASIEHELFARAPVAQRLAATRDAVERGTAAEIARRKERTAETYDALIQVTTLASAQASTLTDNAGFISVATGLARAANTLLSTALAKNESRRAENEADQTVKETP